MRILLTGGAGFIGRTWIRENIDKRDVDKIYIIDSLLPQVHTTQDFFMNNCEDSRIEFVHSSIQGLDKNRLIDILRDCDSVVHLASDTGVGQSMYELVRYTENNVVATAALLEAIPVAWDGNFLNKRLILSSSRAVYGEGAYFCDSCKGTVDNTDSKDKWDPICSTCGNWLRPIPTPVDTRTNASSIYASTKLSQEHMVQQISKALGIRYSILRFFNVFGPGQALGNPYTGIMTTFLLRAMQMKPLYVFEDGCQTRDFVFIDDVIAAITSALDCNVSGIYNIGTGIGISIQDMARLVSAEFDMGPDGVQITGRHRVGDIRHCTADITATTRDLNWYPHYTATAGMTKYIKWFKQQTVNVADDSEKAWQELVQRGLGKTML